MATVNYRNGRAEVRFYDHRGDRRSVALGKITKRAAESALTHIQGLLNSKIGGLQANAENIVWVSNQRSRIVDYLAGLDLIQPRKVEAVAVTPEVKQVPTIDDWFSQYIENRQGSEGTKIVWTRAKNQAVKFFGKGCRIDSITTGGAITWFEQMLNGDKSGKGILAEATARKMVGVARQVFKRAVKFKHISENPFADEDLKTTVGHREKQYIDLPTIQQLLQILPSAEWRAVVIFARFAGMRVQSELPLLKWSDVLWDEDRFVVRRSPKTKTTRRTPIFPEIRQALEDLLPITGESEYVLNVMRTKSKNWRTPLEKMMERAGMKPWDALFNALRASGETDIAQKYGLQCAVEWVGNSVQIAMKHYVRATAADFERAANQDSSFAPKVAPESVGTEGNGTEPLPVLLPSLQAENPAIAGKPNKKRASGITSLARKVDDIGLETIGGTAVLETTCEEPTCNEKPIAPKVAPNNAEFNLQTVIDAWPRLSESQRQQIFNVIDSAT